jgi:hypothetical protein
MKIKLDRIISLATLIASVVAIVLVVKKPTPVAQPQPPTAVPERAQTTDQKTEPQWLSPPSQNQQSQNQPPQTSSSWFGKTDAPPAPPTPATNSKPSSQNKSDDTSSMLSKLLGSAGGSAGLSPDSNIGSGMPNIKDQQVTMDGDVIHGRFLTEIAGKDVWITISGHMGEKDGYATFEPTEFKIGDMEVPVSLVNPALQRKLAEERDRLKIPNGGPQ